MSVVFQAEIDTNDINPNYFCTDQTNINQQLTSRNFYDSALINLYLPNTNTVIGNCLYNSVNCQQSEDFSKIFQNIWSAISVDYNGIVGAFNVNYIVKNSEYIRNSELIKKTFNHVPDRYFQHQLTDLGYYIEFIVLLKNTHNGQFYNSSYNILSKLFEIPLTTIKKSWGLCDVIKRKDVP